MHIKINRGSKGDSVLTQIDSEDFELVQRHSWHVSLGYAKTNIKGSSVGMHRVLLGLTNPAEVVDHINQDKLDNRRANLRVVSRGANNQNRKKRESNKSSSSTFKGVIKREFKTTTKWVAECSGYYESFDTEDEAALAYDKAALHKFGVGCHTNFPYTPDETQVILNEKSPTTPLFKKESDLPRGVWYDPRSKNRPYGCRYGKKTLGMHASAEEASKVYLNYVQKFKEEREAEHLQKTITRNSEGQAIISKGAYDIIVDDELWHDLSRYSYCLNPAGYVTMHVQKCTTSMHRFLMKPPEDMVVDHINGDKLDNRRSNLRVVTPQQNSYNKKKQNLSNASSQYKGVSKHSRNGKNGPYARYLAKVNNTNVGWFDTEIEAALAYNIKAKEMHGDFAYLNVIPEAIDPIAQPSPDASGL